jgi:hypothetical protein
MIETRKASTLVDPEAMTENTSHNRTDGLTRKTVPRYSGQKSGQLSLEMIC